MQLSLETTNLHISALSCIMQDTEHNTLWHVESLGTTLPNQNPERDFLEEYLNTKITVQPDGTYSLKFPWTTKSHQAFPRYKLSKVGLVLFIFFLFFFS